MIVFRVTERHSLTLARSSSSAVARIAPYGPRTSAQPHPGDDDAPLAASRGGCAARGAVGNKREGCERGERDIVQRTRNRRVYQSQKTQLMQREQNKTD